MTRATRFMLYTLPAVFFYVLAVLGVVDIPLVGKTVSDELVPVIPWWLLVAAGAFSLGSLGMGLLQFRECPEAYEELLKEITQAKNELRDQGVSVD